MLVINEQLHKNFQPVTPTPLHPTLPGFVTWLSAEAPNQRQKRWRLRRSLFVSFDVEDDKLTAVINIA